MKTFSLNSVPWKLPARKQTARIRCYGHWSSMNMLIRFAVYQQKLRLCQMLGCTIWTDPTLFFQSCASWAFRCRFQPPLCPAATPFHPLFYFLISPVPTSLFPPAIFSASGRLPQVPPFTFASQRALNMLTATLMKEPITNSLLLLLVLWIIFASRWSLHFYMYLHMLY